MWLFRLTDLWAGVPPCGTGRSCVRLYCCKNADIIPIRRVCVKIYFGGGGAKNSQAIDFFEVIVSNFIVYAHQVFLLIKVVNEPLES